MAVKKKRWQIVEKESNKEDKVGEWKKKKKGEEDK